MTSCENNLNTLTFLGILTSGKSSSLFYSVLTLITKSKVEASRISLFLVSYLLSAHRNGTLSL